MSNTAKLARTEANSALGAGGSARRGVKVSSLPGGGYEC
jgi:hypothetical protein